MKDMNDRLAEAESLAYESSDDGTADRTEDRHPRVAPATVALVSHRQNGVSDTRREVSGGIHGVSGRTTE